ncbi:putative EPIDERMAL PATTERNING FACTOR-like protein [Helianthus annuus]|nr:putative EPIDERMAL PATTERNING FACTOR-like protein [Helianthus annuus]
MAPTRTYLTILLLSLTVSHSISGYEDEGVASVQQNKRILQSSPPSCMNKCENCTPCEATLVNPLDPKLIDYKDQSLWEHNYNYYPQVWKCKCGDKLYEP